MDNKIAIAIKIDEILLEFSQDFQAKILEQYSKEIEKNWIDLANKNLNRTRKQYIEGIKVDTTSDYKLSLSLEGDLPNMIESGTPKYDMKPGFAQSAKKKISKTGSWYLIIPFQYATKQNQSGKSVMPRSVYEAIRKSKTKSLKTLPPKYSGVSKNKVTGVQHKAPIYQGIQKRGNSYMNFRVVSQKSDPNSWIHPGLKAENLLDKAIEMTNFNSIVQNLLAI